VWAGKGLLSWALAEPGQGKNLITGRLTRRGDFGEVAALYPKGDGQDGQLSPLEALVAAHDARGEGEREAWGIEVRVQVRDNTRPPPMAESGMFGAGQDVKPDVRAIQGQRHWQRRDSNASIASTGSAVAHPARIPSKAYSTNGGAAHTSPIRPSEHVGQKRKISHAYSHSADHTLTGDAKNDRALSARDLNLDDNTAASGSKMPIKRGLVQAKGGGLYDVNDPSSMTQEQAKRLLESPSFLELLERTANKPDSAGARSQSKPTGAHARQGGAVPDAKRFKQDDAPTHAHATNGSTGENKTRALRHTYTHTAGGKLKLEMKCWNCSRTKSSVWRSRTMEDGTTVRVCNGTSRSAARP
jgi:hypothetical protein